MSGRKPNGESWISETPNAQGLYEAKVWMGLKGNGKPDRRNVRRKALPDLRKRVKELEKARDAGRVVKAGRPPTIRVMLDRHLGTVLPGRNRSPSTIQSYRSLCKVQIYPRWGAQRADRLRPEDVEDGVAAMMRAGLAPSSVRKVLAVLSSAYEIQVKRGNLLLNPCGHVEPPGLPESEILSLSQAETRRVVKAALGRPNHSRWTVGLGAGLRQGEALGLRRSYVNLETGETRVWWQLQRLTWSHGCADLEGDPSDDERILLEHACAAPHCKLKPCRKKAGKCRLHSRPCPPPCPPGCTSHARLCPHRAGGGLVLRPVKEKKRKTVWLDPVFLESLADHLERQDRQRDLIGHEWQEHDLVWCQWNGRPIDPRRDWQEWGVILGTAGLGHHRLHAMRHSTATIMQEEGVAMGVVQHILGHSDIRMTRRYTHTDKPLAQDASGRMGRALGLVRKDAS